MIQDALSFLARGLAPSQAQPVNLDAPRRTGLLAAQAAFSTRMTQRVHLQVVNLTNRHVCQSVSAQSVH
jgi:hypothetical protein